MAENLKNKTKHLHFFLVFPQRIALWMEAFMMMMMMMENGISLKSNIEEYGGLELRMRYKEGET